MLPDEGVGGDSPAESLRLRLISGSTKVETESIEVSDLSVAIVSTDERLERRWP